MSGADHQHSAAVDVAAEWLATTPRHQISGALVPAIRQRFGLSAQEACEAIAQARLRRSRAI